MISTESLGGERESGGTRAASLALPAAPRSTPLNTTVHCPQELRSLVKTLSINCQVFQAAGTTHCLSLCEPPFLLELKSGKNALKRELI